jgi:UDP-N-acetylbacillosamine N-acetyltransferase
MRQDEQAQLVIFGCGGHGRSVAATALSLGYESIVFIDPAARGGETLLDMPVFSRLPEDARVNAVAIATSGEARKRERQILDIRKAGLRLTTLVAPSAVVATHASLGSGVFVGPNAYVGPLAQIEDGVIINTRAMVEHDSTIGAFTHVAVGAIVAGRCHVGQRCFIGAGAVVIDDIVIGDDIIVGAGATVVGQLHETGKYVGTPAKRQ